VIKVSQSNFKKVLDRLTVPLDFLQKIYKNNEHNEPIIKHYKRLQRETKLDTLFNKIQSMSTCNTSIEIDKYEAAKVKDYKRTNLCRDKFCANCKKVTQAARMGKYIPELEKYCDCLYHMTLTQSNCSAEDLPYTIKKMASKFQHLMRFISGRKKIRGLEFTEWGYLGAIRSLEVTFKKDKYHPHYHVALALDCDELGEKTIQNTYSRSYKSDKAKLFCEKEILIQKIWRLLMTDQEVTQKAIDALEEGYSCVIEPFPENQYAELFKYMAKSTDQDSNLMTYANFKTLYFALLNVHQIRGYGVFHQIKNEVTEEMIEQTESVYNTIIEYLQKKEAPINQIDRLEDLIKDFNLYTLISRKRIFKYLVDLVNDTE
jgi:hypothetical protein